MIFFTQRSAMTALLTVVVIGSAALMMSIAIALRGIGESDLAVSSVRLAQVDALLSGCSDEALLRLSRDQTFGQGVPVRFPLGAGTCTITSESVVGTTLETYAIIITAERQRTKKSARVTVLVPTMQILSWDASIDPSLP